ncbi:MAG: PEP-CTERM sorting domain-containing protein [Opitutales bacterium]
MQRLTCLWLGISFSALALPAQALDLDTFTDPFTTALETNPGDLPAMSTEVGGAGFLFDQRVTTLQAPTGGPGLANSFLAIDGGTGQLGFINNSNVTGSAFEILYTSAVGEDLTDGGINSVFEIDVAFSDIAAPEMAQLTVSVTDGGSDSSFFSTGFAGPGTLVIPFGEFSSDVDFGDIVSLSLGLDASGVSAPDVVINSVSTAIPEPGTYGALAVGVLGLLILRRRLQR